jgi:hypothetical protein
MRGFTEFAGRLTRLVYCKARGGFVAEAVPHAFEAGGAVCTPSPSEGTADAAPHLHAVTCPNQEKQK